ncbi:AAA family ATPase [Nocardioides terrisoli]|uniref:AAA family ATPase n=1 Tax=Nocardioides terrisoli TaxID=3388267 RepID=UPI00287B7E28|nr:AAA family ATPase [Nocardioides marmorisolisilvae]
MTSRFRIDQFRLETVEGPVTYNFTDDLTVLAGDTGVGKTTLFELIKFALGGDGLIAPVAAKNVSEVHLSIQVGTERLQLSRELDGDRRKNMRVTDLITGDVRPKVAVSSDKETTVSGILLSALGLSTTMRAAARSPGSSRKGALITFYDLFKYMYVPQAAINQDIAGSRDTYYEPKRKSVFELLFGLTDAEVLDMQSELNDLNGKVAEANREAETINQFLTHSGMKLRIDAELALAQAIKEEKEGQDALIHLASEVEEVVDRETQVLRELLTDSERALNDAQELVSSLDREEAQYRAERHQVEQDITRLHQMASAGQRLANIEFVVCPRCTQSLNQRQVPDDVCRVCMQHDSVKNLTRGQYETAQLVDQVEEVDLQLTVIAKQASDAAEAVQNRRNLVSSLTAQIERRTANRVTPRLQAYTDAAAKAARAKAQQEHLEEVLQRWDRASDLQTVAETLESQRSALKTAIGAAKSALDERRRSVLSQLTDEFATTVAAFRIPASQGATIDPKTYLPLLDGQPFNQVSSAGGIATATQVAYWMSLVAVAIRLNDTAYPAFLMIDSPRLAVSSTEDISGQMYSRFVTQVGVVPNRLQFIVADNEMPKDYVRRFTEFKFSYEDPTISTVEHPGPADVVPLTAESDPA